MGSGQEADRKRMGDGRTGDQGRRYTRFSRPASALRQRAAGAGRSTGDNRRSIKLARAPGWRLLWAGSIGSLGHRVKGTRREG